MKHCGGSECYTYVRVFNPLNAKLNPTCHSLALLGAHPILHISRVRVKHVGNCSYFWAMIGESGPDLVFLFRVLVGFLLYLSIEFLEQLLWYIVVFRYCL